MPYNDDVGASQTASSESGINICVHCMMNESWIQWVFFYSWFFLHSMGRFHNYVNPFKYKLIGIQMHSYGLNLCSILVLRRGCGHFQLIDSSCNKRCQWALNYIAKRLQMKSILIHISHRMVSIRSNPSSNVHRRFGNYQSNGCVHRTRPIQLIQWTRIPSFYSPQFELGLNSKCIWMA